MRKQKRIKENSKKGSKMIKADQRAFKQEPKSCQMIKDIEQRYLFS